MLPQEKSLVMKVLGIYSSIACKVLNCHGNINGKWEICHEDVGWHKWNTCFLTQKIYCRGNNAIDDGSVLFTTPKFYLNLVATINETTKRATRLLGGGSTSVKCYVGALWESMGVFSREHNFDSIFSAQFLLEGMHNSPQNMNVLPIDFHATAMPNNIGRAMSCFAMCIAIKKMSIKFHFVIPSHVSRITCLNLLVPYEVVDQLLANILPHRQYYGIYKKLYP